MKKVFKKIKLTKEEMDGFLERTKGKDPKKDHSLAMRTLINPMRRDMMSFIGYDVKTDEVLMEHFELDKSQIEYHLNMLVQISCIIKSEEGWKITPRAAGFLENWQLDG